MPTTITLSTIAPIVYKIGKKIIDADTKHWYGLEYPVDYGIIRTTRFKAFDYSDDIFEVTKIDEYRSRWYLKEFSPETHYFDGTTALPDKGTKNLDCLFRAAIFHDCGYAKVEAISKATGVPESDLLAFFDDCLKLLADGYGANKTLTKSVWGVTRVLGSAYHALRKIIVVLLILSLCGCGTIPTEFENDTPPEIHWTGPFIIGETK